MNAVDSIGWLITATHDDDDDRVGYGMGAEQAQQTHDSYEAVIGRTIFVRSDLTVDMIPFDKRVKWRSFSDDGDPAYDGVCHIDWLYAPDEWPEADQDMAFNIDRFNLEDWGAACVFYNAADIRRCRPELAEHVATHTRINPDGDAGKSFLREAKIDPQAWIEIYS
jgi:hypothetical protein